MTAWTRAALAARIDRLPLVRHAMRDRVRPSSHIDCPDCARPAGLCCVDERGAARRQGLHPARMVAEMGFVGA